MSWLEQGAVVSSIIFCLLAISMGVRLVIAGHAWGSLLQRIVPLLYGLVWPGIVWGGMKPSRHGKVAAAMLKHLRCPHCGYDIRGLPTDPGDGATICPECGCAWRLSESDVSDAPSDAWQKTDDHEQRIRAVEEKLREG